MAVSILLVDDDDGFRSLVAETFRAAGHDRVHEASTVAAALRAAAELTPDVVLVDIGLPDGDGLQLAGELARLAQAPRIVLISTDADAADDDAVQQVGAAGFVAKDELDDARLLSLLEAS